MGSTWIEGVRQFPPNNSNASCYIYLSGSCVNAWEIDSRDKLNRRRVVWVVGAAVDVEAVYPVLMDTLGRAS